ncbi:hypothetical protein O5D80_005460 [Batrachochytrium dendrobatidis]|nr:hypothetical protein O5D80_005460 [Batrachochytrium dendrobatidis]
MANSSGLSRVSVIDSVHLPPLFATAQHTIQQSPMHRSIDDVSPHASCSDTASNAHCHRTSDTVKSRIRPNNGRSKQHSSGSKNIASHANAGNCESGSDGLPAAAAAARQQSIPSVNPTPSVNNKSTILSKNNLPPSALNDKWQTKFQEQYRGSRSRHALPYSTYATMASAIDNPNPSKGRMSESTAAKLNALRPKLLGMAFAPWSILEYMTFTGPPLEYGGNTTSESRSPRDKHARNPSAFPSKSLQSAHPALETHYKLRASDTGSSSLSKSASVPLGKHESSAQLSTVARSSTNPPLRGGDDCSAAMRDSISDRTFSDSLYISTGKLNSDRDSRLTTALATESLNSVEKDKCALLSDSDLKQSIRYKSAPLNVSAMDPVIVINDGYMSSDAIKPDMSFKQVDGAVSTLKSTPLESPRLATAQTTGTASDTNFKPQNKPVARPAYSFGKIKQKTLADSKQSQPQATIINTENQKLECHGSSNTSSASMGQSAHNDPKKEFNVLLIKGWEQVHKRLHSVVIKIPISISDIKAAHMAQQKLAQSKSTEKGFADPQHTSKSLAFSQFNGGKSALPKLRISNSSQYSSVNKLGQERQTDLSSKLPTAQSYSSSLQSSPVDLSRSNSASAGKSSKTLAANSRSNSTEQRILNPKKKPMKFEKSASKGMTERKSLQSPRRPTSAADDRKRQAPPRNDTDEDVLVSRTKKRSPNQEVGIERFSKKESPSQSRTTISNSSVAMQHSKSYQPEPDIDRKPKRMRSSTSPTMDTFLSEKSFKASLNSKVENKKKQAVPSKVSNSSGKVELNGQQNNRSRKDMNHASKCIEPSNNKRKDRDPISTNGTEKVASNDGLRSVKRIKGETGVNETMDAKREQVGSKSSLDRDKNNTKDSSYISPPSIPKTRPYSQANRRELSNEMSLHRSAHEDPLNHTTSHHSNSDVDSSRNIKGSHSEDGYFHKNSTAKQDESSSRSKSSSDSLAIKADRTTKVSPRSVDFPKSHSAHQRPATQSPYTHTPISTHTVSSAHSTSSLSLDFNTRGTHSFTAASPVKPLTETDWRQLGIHHKRSGDANNLRIKNSSRGSPRYKQARVMQCLHYSASVICFMMTTSIRDEASGTNSYVNACPSKETCVDSLLKAAFGLMRSEDWDPLHSLLLRCHASLITRALNFTQRAYQNQQRDKTRLQRKLDDTTIPNDIARLDTELQKISAQIYANATWYTEMSGFVVSTMKQAGKLCPDFHQMFHAYMLKGPISADSKPVVICETANHILEAFAASRFPDFFFEFFPECLTTMS